MGSFDFGVSLAFWLTMISTLLCVYYGVVNWNKGASSKMDKTVEHWAQEEQKIEEEL